jgi:hypothetical protein
MAELKATPDPVEAAGGAETGAREATNRMTADAATRWAQMGDLTLIGTYGTEGEMRALVRRSGRIEPVGPGDWLGGRRVLAVVPGALRLLDGESTVELRLPDPDAPRA